MNNNFKNYIDLIEYIDKRGAIFVPENFAWAKSISKSLPSQQLELPTIEKRGKIVIIMDKKNPIYVQLSDNSKLYFSHDEYRRIEGKPEKGKTMIVNMQRLPQDNSDLPSQIVRCKVI
jgi:hypothetical protein